MTMKDKKGQIAQIQSLITPLVVIAIVLAIGFLILAEVRTQAVNTASNGSCSVADGTCGLAVNGTVKVQSALDDIPGWLPIIIITVIGAILIGLVSIFRRE